MKKIFTLILTSALFSAAIAQTAGKDAALETLGASSGLLLYNTYLTLGTASDAYAGDCYEASMVTTIAEEQINSIDMIIKQYNTLLATDFLTETNDRAFVGDMVVAFGYLKNQATYLKAYTETGSEEDSKKYEYNRNEAWARISSLLGFEEEKKE